MSSLVQLLASAGRLSALLVWERCSNPKVRRAGETPPNERALTAEWFTDVLCADRPGVEVTGIERGTASSGSTVRRQFLLTYNAQGEEQVAAEVGQRGGLPRSVFAKLTPTLRARLAYGSGAMVDESLFLNALRPQLGPAFEAPWGYFASYDLRTCRSIQMMEDLVATRDASFGTPETQISRVQAEEVITTLATLHGTFNRDPRLDTRYTTLRTVGQWYRSAEPFRLDKYHGLAMNKAAHVIPPHLHRRRAETWPAFMRSVARHAELPQTLLHSDVHLGNWYMTGDGHMGLGDWGCVMKGNWARDVAYALSGTLTVENRRAWERDLISLYIEAVRLAGGDDLSFDNAWLLYRQQLFQGLLMWTPTLCHSPLLPDMQPEHVALEMIKRTATAIDDLDALDAV
ncbi:MAG: phosphotransferase [Gammaproteobacteria bacterium]|nr:phosphotransferase [Gammaproteobacteria bacterium]